ncbi:unnamed protein product [Cuscuta campestris]|uniref:CCHC-type domain-containing protein n=1 Tax=Cuscuta campestris TaxID=132261 RepID=A0A484K4X1_9ASTE|nr:unnamed protein product [Cuscuta campestris]
MTEDGRVRIEKFNGTDFAWWKMQIDALLGECDLDMVLEEKPDGMDKAAEAIWDSKDKKARGMKFDDDTQAVILLSSLPDSWSGFVTTVTKTAGTGNLKFDRIRDSVLGEDIRRRNASGGSTSGLLSVSRGRGNNRNSGSRGKSSSKAGKNVVCWVCKEVGHVKSQCPNKKNKISAVVGNASDDDSDALILSMESYVDSWVMDFGASFHAMHSGEAMVNLKKGDFGKVKLGNGKILKVTGMGDIDLKTSFGTTWSLQNVRVIPRLKTKLISVGQLDEQGLDVKIWWWKMEGDQRKFVIARGLKRGPLYMVPVTSELVTNPVKTVNKVGLTESGKAKKVHFANVNLGVLGMTVECVRSLLDLESGNGPRCISGSGGLCKPVETEAVADTVTTGLELGGASTVLSGY